MVNSADAKIIRKILSLCRCQCLDRDWGEEIVGKGVSFEVFSIFSVKFPTLGTGKLFKSDTVQPSKLNFSFGGHLVTNSLGLVAKGFF